MKKLISILATIISFAFLAQMAIGLSPVKKAFPDVIFGKTKYAHAIDFLKDEEIVKGYSDGNYKPEKLLNRAEFLKILEDLIVEEEIDESLSKKECFKDVPANEWYTKYVCYAKETGVVSGYKDGTFKPEQTINLVEALKITLSAFGFEYKKTSTWYKGLVETASYMEIIPPDFTSFSQKVNRGQMAELATRTKKYDLDELAEFLSDEYNGLEYPAVTYDTLEEGIDVEGEDEDEDVSYCTDKPTATEIGSPEYPTDPQYEDVGSYLGQLLTASDCDDATRIKGIFGVSSGKGSKATFTLGSNITLKEEGPSDDFLEVLTDIGYECSDTESEDDSTCSEWELTDDDILVDDLLEIKPYVDEIESGDCVNCG